MVKIKFLVTFMCMKETIEKVAGETFMDGLINFIDHLKILVRPLLVSIIICGLWYTINRYFGIHFDSSDHQIIGPVIGGVLLVWGIFAKQAYGEVRHNYRENKKLLITVIEKKGKKKDFSDVFIETMSWTYNFFLFITTGTVLVCVGLIDFKTNFDGVVIMFLISFVVLLFYELINELDQPEAPWYKDHEPEYWDDETH